MAAPRKVRTPAVVNRYIAFSVYNESSSRPSCTVEEAFEDLRVCVLGSESLTPADCTFYELKEIQVLCETKWTIIG